MKFKKTLLSLALLAGVSAGAQADVLTFVETANSGSTVVEFDGWDFSLSTATATQTDDGDGFLTGTESFVELGGFSTITMDLNNLPNPASGVGSVAAKYDIFAVYNLTGMVQSASVFPGTLSQLITFNSGDVTFYLEDLPGNDADQVFAGPLGAGVTELFSASLNASGSNCNLGSALVGGLVVLGSGGCSANFTVDIGSTTAGFLFSGANDWATLSKINIAASLDIRALTGLYFSYAAQEAVTPDGIAVQNFTIEHDASASFSIPEPASIAVMGLGLLGLGGFARRRK